ncbi:GIY-YIG nuclease family protein [Paractinoplanes maris]|uniref:GIY-YIG nuclease family protein n=1 Tax=Paractinoplanes maris TaxID=1734446 RepID=UPI00201FF440|nr:GIY-YIG nuclease family protein [Actinoplanes maris]
MPFLSELESRTDGCIYVVRFDNDEFKVGRSQNMHTRLRSLRIAAGQFRRRINGGWYSPDHADWLENETRLIDFCLETFGAPTWGLEQFRGDYSVARQYAEWLTASTDLNEGARP